jgi:hypothetical protein
MGHIEKFKNFSRNRVNSIKNLSWEDVKSFGNRSWDFLKRESNETKQAAEILNKMISGRDVTENEKKFLKEQSKDLIRIISAGTLPMPITAILVALGKKYNFEVLPGNQKELKELIEKEKEELGVTIEVDDSLNETKAKSSKTKSGRKVPGKYLTKNKSAMKKEIDEFQGSSDYKTEWDADYKSGKGGDGKRYKTKKSNATKAYQKKYGKE